LEVASSGFRHRQIVDSFALLWLIIQLLLGLEDENFLINGIVSAVEYVASRESTAPV
jgi:hypothetical protein